MVAKGNAAMKQIATTAELLPEQMQQRVDLPALSGQSSNSGSNNEFVVEVMLTIQLRIRASWSFQQE
jgi:hypothetical protein